MSNIKISELADGTITLESFLALAGSDGIAFKGTVDELQTFVNTIAVLGLKAAISAADAVPTEDGLYPCQDTGTYTNFGGLVVDVSDTITFISVSGTQTVFKKVEIPVTITIDSIPTEGSTNAVESGGVESFRFYTKNYKDNSISREKTRFFSVVSRNLWNIENIELNVLIQISNGVESKSTNTSYNYSGYIPVVAGDSYISNHNNSFVLFYDVDKEPLSQINNGGFAHITPAGTYFIRAMQYNNNANPVYYRKSELTYIEDVYKVSDNTIELNEDNFNETFEIQDKNLNLVDYSSANLINSVPKVIKKRRDTSTGLLVNSTTNCTTELIPIDFNTKYIKKQFGNVYYYGAGGESDFISFFNASGNTAFTTPNDALVKFIAVDGTLVTEGEGEEWIEEYFYKGAVYPLYLPTTVKKLRNNFITTKLHGKKWAVLGDSLTQPFNTYWAYIFPDKGMSVQNLGISTSTIQVLPQTQQYYPMVQRYTDIDSDCDIITVFGGVNDADYGDGTPSAIGVSTDTATNTFYGALDTLYKGLLVNYTTKKIGIITPLQRVGAGTENETLSDYVDAILIVAKRYSLPVLDLFSMSGLNPNVAEIKLAYFDDDIHPSTEGQKFIAKKIGAFIETL
tara:strand:- start:461 stop:2335 length:1875 start_codon:yes stop_codon:yes gene_type:complete